MSGDTHKLSVDERERAIFRLLLNVDPDVGATIREIYDQINGHGVQLTVFSEPVRDSVTIQVYYKLIERLVITDRLVEIDSGDAKRYALARVLHSDLAMRLDDLEALAEHLAPTEAIAALTDMRREMRAQRDAVLRPAALALCKVPALDLVTDMILCRIAGYNKDVELWFEHGEDDERHLRRIKTEHASIERFCYRGLGLARTAVLAPPVTAVGRSTYDQMIIHVDEQELRTQLRWRIYGDTVIYHVDPTAGPNRQDWTNAPIAGSDGSTYSGAMQIDSATGFTDEAGSDVVTFNNSMVFLSLEGDLKRRHPHPLYSVPITRSEIDNPHNEGMVMAPFMYPEMDDGTYEHFTKCATDVVQWRADQKVFKGAAPALGGGSMLPAPRVHFRDGTVTLQERESHHYQRMDKYGQVVREGVQISEEILQHLLSRRQPPVFAGAVKSSQLDIFGTIINWFIAHGHPASGISAIDPAWDLQRRGVQLADNEMASLLLSTLVPDRGDGYFCTFVLVRPFHALTDMWRAYQREEKDYWVEMLREKQRRHRQDRDDDTWWKIVEPIEDEPYVRMCEQADYAMFYVGHTSGDPLPLAPRYEFMESLRTRGHEEATERVSRNVKMIVSALDHTGFTPDFDHNFMSRKILVKYVPRVVYEAHERCKALGRMLESELKSMIVANLHRLGLLRRGASESVRTRPISFEYAVQRYHDARTREIEAAADGETQTRETEG